VWIALAIFATVGFIMICARLGKIFISEQNRDSFASWHINKQGQNLLASVTSSNRGTPAERDLVLMLLKHGISSQAIFHDLYLRKPHGGFSQIDVVVPTKAGIIVFEVKDYSGWIFGNGNHKNWTQVLAFGKEKNKFYNPIQQNDWHIVQLQKRLGEDVPFFSVIMFSGNCELKDITFVPEGTFIVKPWRVLEVVDTIINNHEPAQYWDKRNVLAVLKEAVQNGDDADMEARHTENVKNMLGKERVYD